MVVDLTGRITKMIKEITDHNEFVRSYINLVNELSDDQIVDLFYMTISCDKEDEITLEDMRELLTDPYTLWEVEEIELEKMYRQVVHMLDPKGKLDMYNELGDFVDSLQEGTN
jgi:hypothetical protein